MRILTVCSYYYPHVGGIEQVARDCVNALKSEHEQRVVCFHHEKGDKTDEIDGVRVDRAGCFAKISSQSLSLHVKKLLRRVFKEFRPEVVIFHYPNPFLAHYLLKILKKFPACKLLLYWHLDITKQKILGKFFRGQNIRLCKRAEYVLGATPKHLEESAYYAYFKDHCKLLPYGIVCDRLKITPEIAARTEEIRRENENKVICFAMGRHVPYKGMEHLIHAAESLDDSYMIYIAGKGPLTESLTAMAQNLPNVKMLGQIDNAEATAYLNACDIFCFPSITRNEGFGLALAEAMYLFKPAVTFHIEHSGVNFVSLNGVTGLEVPNCDDKAYAEAIQTLAKDEELRLRYGKAAHERVAELFTDEIFTKNIRKLIGEEL